MNRLTFSSIIILIITYSCVPQKNVEYMQDIQDNTSFIVPSGADIKIKPNDELYIKVSSFDEVAFNFFGNQMERNTMGASDQAISLISYIVNEDGNVFFPILGEVKLNNLTLLQATKKFEELLDDYFNQPTVIIKFVNKKISILGEVQRPGHYTYSQNTINLLQAISIAGDITSLGNRNEILVMREVENKLTTYIVDMTKSRFISSEVFNLKPGDIIYVKPLRSRKWAINSLPYDLILSSITTFILILNYINK